MKIPKTRKPTYPDRKWLRRTRIAEILAAEWEWLTPAGKLLGDTRLKLPAGGEIPMREVVLDEIAAHLTVWNKNKFHFKGQRGSRPAKIPWGNLAPEVREVRLENLRKANLAKAARQKERMGEFFRGMSRNHKWVREYWEKIIEEQIPTIPPATEENNAHQDQQP